MGIWFVILIVAEIALFLLYIHFLKKYPALYMPFDYQYRVFKRAYRAYRPVKEGKKLYRVFPDDFLHGYERSLERKSDYEGRAVAHRVCNIVENHRSRNECIEAFLRERYGFRYNTVKSRTEYRVADGGTFQPVTKFCLNSIRRELDRTMGINTSAENIRAILESDFTERVNPVQSYFRGLPKATGQNAIARLAATVTVHNPERWTECLTK